MAMIHIADASNPANFIGTAKTIAGHGPARFRGVSSFSPIVNDPFIDRFFATPQYRWPSDAFQNTGCIPFSESVLISALKNSAALIAIKKIKYTAWTTRNLLRELGLD